MQVYPQDVDPGTPQRPVLQDRERQTPCNPLAVPPIKPLAQDQVKVSGLVPAESVLQTGGFLGALTYEAAKKRAEPYNKFVGELPEMRTQTVDLVTRATVQKLRAYILVNNRAEGNTPLTVQALVSP